MKPIYTFFAAATLCVAGALSVSASKSTANNVASSPAAPTEQPAEPTSTFSPQAPALTATEGWHSIGMGTYTEDILSAFIPNCPSQTFEVEIEQSVNDPNLYRAINVYKNWKNPDTEKYSYDAAKATPIVWHVVYDKYAYIDNFNTGVVYTKDGVSEPISVTSDVVSYIGSFGLEYAFEHVANAFASFRFGELTLSAYNNLGVNLTAVCGSTKASANTHGNFKITLPENPIEADPEWKAIGTGKYTDDIIATVNSVHFNVTTFDVEVQQNIADPTLYRLVNPYKNLAIADSTAEFVSYDTNARYHMQFHIYNDGTGYIDDFNTGVIVNGMFPYKVTSAAAAKVNELGLAAAKSACPGAFGKYNASTRTFTMPYKFTYQGTQQFCLDVDCEIGYYEDGVNMHGAFALVIPDGTNVPETNPTEETWTLVSEEEVMFDAITPDLVSGAKASSVKVAVEQSNLKRHRFRVVNPFKNWTPAGSLKVDASKNYYLPFDVYESEGTAYIYDFETGLLNGNTAVTVKSATVEGSKTQCGSFDVSTRKVSIPATFTVGGKQVASMTVGEKAVNTTGLFTITIPKLESGDPTPQDPTEAKWSSLGTGKYTDDILASILDNITVSTFKVEIEEDLNNAGHYRIVNPYKNWKNQMPDFILADPDNEGLIEFWQEGNDVWFTTIKTGLTFGGSPLEVEHLAGSMIKGGERSLQEISTSFPDALAKNRDGLITQSATFEFNGETYASVVVTYDDETYDANVSGKMKIKMPGYAGPQPGPDDEWWLIGIGQYTDDLLPEMFYEGVEPSTFDVEVEKNLWTEGLYRIVDPYKYWENTYSDNIQKYTGEYMVIHAEDPNYVWIENFYTGLKNVSPTAEFRYYASNQIADLIKDGNTISKIKKWYPGACAKMVDNVITYDAGFDDADYGFSWNWRMSFGEEDQRPTVANKNGLFRIDLNVVPVDYDDDDDDDDPNDPNDPGQSSITSVNADTEVEYFDLQGRRVANPANGVYVRRCGDKVDKVMIR